MYIWTTLKTIKMTRKISPFLTLAGVTALVLVGCDAVKQQAMMVAQDAVNQQLNGPSVPRLTSDEAAGGLKEALVDGVMKGTGILGQNGAFLNNAALKILLPPEVQNVEQKIRNNVLLNSLIGKDLDNVIVAMNKGAEKSMNLAVPVFRKAITDMSFADAMKILTGGQGAATSYLKSTSEAQLQQLFMPEVKKALDEVAISKSWNPVVTQINKNKKLLGLSSDIQPDLNLYVTEKATAALFQEIEKQENIIRKDPVARTSEILKKAFDYADKNSAK
jgi:hypothetical protein